MIMIIIIIIIIIKNKGSEIPCLHPVRDSSVSWLRTTVKSWLATFLEEEKL